MAIEWVIAGLTSPMSHQVLDNNGVPPTTVLTAGQPFKIGVKFAVPATLTSLIGNCDAFRLRAFAESQGPGQEVQLAELIVSGVPGQLNYDVQMSVDPNPLLGEGQNFGGQAVSGLYKIVVVAQHLNSGVPTVHSGYSDNEPSASFRAP